MVKQMQTADFINDEVIYDTLETGRNKTRDELELIIEKGRQARGLSLEETAALLQNECPELDEKLFRAAREVKDAIYGTRIVMFAPLYISNYCVNRCRYCGYKCTNKIERKRLTDDEIRREVELIINLGHKRIALEAGEDDRNCPIDYITHAMDVIYNTRVKNGHIRRINVNIAATTVENYRKLKEAGIGTYVLFQETYHRDSYAKYHPAGPKSDYDYHTTAMDRAMESGIDDVGLGVLFGLYDYRYEVLGLLLHAQHLEDKYGVGPHTISVPRLRPAEGVSLEEFPYLVSDYDFKRIVAILRLAVPYTGMILSTREAAGFREEVINLGISQISAGSCTDVGGYQLHEQGGSKPQFELADHRTPLEVLKTLCRQGYLPSYCTACYRAGRTGERFMKYAKSGEIHNLCYPNAMLTFKEYLEDYADEELKELGNKTIEKNLANIPNDVMREKTIERLKRIENGERDLFF
ncbi:MAG: [FeFe] hydrogenase H-cluster radical SAM maturase HydG [Clostridiales bacterium]|jgi:2-iminoacetate synthase|nr:[FeFe] hydrogenase H-cluster radical SAM maturase HydG [Clostridiales bacterium]